MAIDTDRILDAARKLSPSAICDLDRMAEWRRYDWTEEQIERNGQPPLYGHYPFADAATFIREVLRALPTEGEWWRSAWSLEEREPAASYVDGPFAKKSGDVTPDAE